MSAQATPLGPHPGGFPTIARVGVGVNEAGVEYLFSKSLDQLLGYLGRHGKWTSVTIAQDAPSSQHALSCPSAWYSHPALPAPDS